MSTSNGRAARRLTFLVSAIVVCIVVLVAVGAFLFLGERTVEGVVLDGLTAQPLANARVVASGRSVTTDRDGRFSLAGVRLGTSVELDRDGYRPASVLVGSDASLQARLEPYVLTGVVLDAASGQPIPGAAVVVGEHQLSTESAGQFSFAALTPGTEVTVQAPGYEPTSFAFDPNSTPRLALNPNSLNLAIVNASTGQPLTGAIVRSDSQVLAADETGQACVQRVLPGEAVTVEAPGFAQASLTYDGQSEARIELRPNSVAGTITDEGGKPLAGVTVSTGTSAVTTDESGRFEMTDVPLDATITVRKQGFAPSQVDVSQQSTVHVAIKPESVRALYLTYYGVGNEGILGNALDLIKNTEANALVIDIKGDRGWLAYKSKVPMVAEIGAQQEITIEDPQKFVQEMHDRGIYLIARIVSFKDDPLAKAHPEWAVHDTVTGGLWIDNEGLAWIDPFHSDAWGYNIAIAKEAAEYGFDEIQFDYVRFPTDASADTTVDRIGLAEDNLKANRVRAISGFLQRAKDELKPYGVLVAADVFGYVCWRTDDMGIGQHLETLGKVVDVISPMVYPTLYWDGIPVAEGPAFETDAPAHPYEIVQQSLRVANARLKESGATAVLRPWLQYYNDYVMDVPYGDHEIRVQKQATYDNDIQSWMFWDPSNNYAKGGFDPKS